MYQHHCPNLVLAKIRRASERLNKELTVSRLLAAWFSSCLILSLVIFLKFYLVSVPWIVTFNIAFYFNAYYVIPVLSFTLLISFFAPSKQQMTKGKLHTIAPIAFFCALLLFWIYATITFRILPDYLTSIVPIGLLIYVYFTKFSATKRFKKFTVIIISLGFMLVLFLPYFSAYQGYSMLLNTVQSNADATDQAIAVSKAAMTLTGNGYLIHNLVRASYQSSEDFSKFLICGAGSCGETAMFEQACFERLGFETMKVSFPGEDHAFVEVKINSTWLVLDPGYSMTLVSRSYRASARINETGTISYVTGNSKGTFAELTQDYVPTDTVTIRITQGNTPVQGASVTLIHQLRYDTSSYQVAVPGNGFSFHTDANGTIVIHLGKIGEGAYNSEFGKTDPFYQVYINGQSTEYKVNSTGTGLNTFMTIDLSNR
jgi:hypothetical protein